MLRVGVVIAGLLLVTGLVAPHVAHPRFNSILPWEGGHVGVCDHSDGSQRDYRVEMRRWYGGTSELAGAGAYAPCVLRDPSGALVVDVCQSEGASPHVFSLIHHVWRPLAEGLTHSVSTRRVGR